MRVRLETLGCRLNISEVESIARKFMAAGHWVVGPDEVADLCVLNTCTVTGAAARKSRQIIRHLKRTNPGAAVVVTGCYAELEPDQVTALGVDLVLGNQDKDRLVELVEEHTSAWGLWDDTQKAANATPPMPDFLYTYPGARTRAFIKVQDGCDNRCTFCIVTVARGVGRSRPADDVIGEVQNLVRAGYQEVVLSGVHLGSYGHDAGEQLGLFHLVHRLLNETEVPRLRLSSLEPWDLDADFFTLWENPRLGRHLHLPLQSGCDATLKRMARRTTAADYSQLVAAARGAIPDLSVTTDIMVGFPGETELEFSQSLAFVEAMAFAKLHIFRYSRRPGTVAASMQGQVPPDTMAERSRRTRTLGARLERTFRSSFVGRTMDVLWETYELDGDSVLWKGLTSNYLRVSAPGGPDLRNAITTVRMVTDTSGGLTGYIVDR
ncbi:MAG: tRNA (N(6)-L-threonylcarbamoyladenosine(37)-C(2))-methylthiotransferase MtaB [Anaerolineales bacterium]|nr:MAG: tRNA (N(6)-L-threonylcarbamoyladenosine(37)-C(2))-methylthiotransferase MtaB [Anaerolineales bacterium]